MQRTLSEFDLYWIAEGAYLHRNQIGVILDWVPAHFPGDEAGLGYFHGSYLYEHADPELGQQPEWSTFVINYSRDGVHNCLISNALFWLDKYHADGLSRRCGSLDVVSRVRPTRSQWISTVPLPIHGQPFSLNMTLSPLGIVVFRLASRGAA